PGTVAVSGLTGQGCDELLHAIDAALTADPLIEARFRIPQAEGHVISALERGATLSRQKFDGNLLYVTAIGPASLLDRYRKYHVRDEAAKGPDAKGTED
ncbi:MAG: GTPase HflX, partial [Bryocella sp.]